MPIKCSERNYLIMRKFSETSLTIAVSDYLKGEIHKGRSIIRMNVPFPGLLWTFVANEGRSLSQGAKFKRMGVRPGVADILLWWNGKTMAIELKKPDGGVQSHNQKEFMRRFEQEGGKYAICRSVAGVKDTLIGWGLKCENPNAIEPALTFEEKVGLVHEVYKRRASEPDVCPPDSQPRKGFDF